MKWSFSSKVVRRLIIPVALIVCVLAAVIVISIVTSSEESDKKTPPQEVALVETPTKTESQIMNLEQYYEDRYDMRIQEVAFFQEVSGNRVASTLVKRPVF